MRLFFAIRIPVEVQAALGRLKPSTDDPDYRWAPSEQLHVTLAFLGNQPAEQVDQILAVGGAAAAACAPGVLRLGQPGSFGAARAPRVVWVGLQGDLAVLEALQVHLGGGLKNARIDFDDTHAFRPHITLARRRDSVRGGAPAGWPPPRPPEPSSFAVRHLTLFESRLNPRGATYVSLGELPLRGVAKP